MALPSVEVICFGASYGVALVGELARLGVRSPLRRTLTIAATSAGLVAQTWYLASRWVATSTPPITTTFDSLLVLSWLLAAIYLYLAVQHRRHAIGFFLLPLIVGLVAVAGSPAFNAQPTADWPGFIALWVTVHVGLLILGSLAVTAAFLAALMYLIQVRRLKAKLPPTAGLTLPSLEQLEKLNSGAVFLAFPLLTLGLAVGAILALYLRRQAYSISLLDPSVLAALAAWVLLALLLHWRYQPAKRGRKVAYLTILAFGLVLLTLFGIRLFDVSTWHGSTRAVAGGAAPEPVGDALP